MEKNITITTTENNTTYTIFDITGKQIISGNLHENNIRMNELPTGVYIVKIDNNKEILYQTFIKN